MKTFQAPCGLAPSVYDVDFLCFLVFRKLIKLFLTDGGHGGRAGAIHPARGGDSRGREDIT